MYPIYSSAGAVPALGPRIDRLTVLRAIAGIWFPHRQQAPDEVYATGARKRNMNHRLTSETVDRIRSVLARFPEVGESGPLWFASKR
jgi:phage terminase large subunit-like protein